MTSNNQPSPNKTTIVSSKHLADAGNAALSELEYALTTVYNAFNRWIVHCLAASGYADFNSLDVLVLHNVNHRQRAKRLTDIAFTLNVDDTHAINYSMKKLVNAELVQGQKVGKEMFYQTTPLGQQVCATYAAIRNDCLVKSLQATHMSQDDLAQMALQLRTLSGLYDQASRAASTL